MPFLAAAAIIPPPSHAISAHSPTSGHS